MSNDGITRASEGGCPLTYAAEYYRDAAFRRIRVQSSEPMTSSELRVLIGSCYARLAAGRDTPDTREELARLALELVAMDVRNDD